MELVFPRLETERLVLRQVKTSDAEDLFAYLSDIEVMKHYGTEPFDKVERVDQAIEKYDTMFREQRGLRLGIEWKESGKLIGNCGFYNWLPDQFNAEMVAVLRDYTFVFGEFRDLMVYGLLKYEYERK